MRLQMGLDPLKAVLPPPLNPPEVLDADAWEGAERQLGTRLPADFKAFVNTYGTGRIDDFLVVFNPFSSNRFVNLIERGRSDLEGMAMLKQGFPQSYPFDVYPAPGGLLPCAATDNGNILYWRTVGVPEQWPIVVYESRGPSYCISGVQLRSFWRPC